MMNHRLLPQSPVCSVRADTSIGDCVRILRNRSLGALIVYSDDASEEIAGIFTERDLVKNIELIQRGSFWSAPVRTVMTTQVRTIRVEDLHQAPKVMARHNIRHLPVVTEGKGRTRVVGVLSMRDIFRIAMEGLDFDLGNLFHLSRPHSDKEVKKKLVGVFSTDSAILDVVDHGAKLTTHYVVKGALFGDDWDSISEHFSKFDILFVDIDGMNDVSQAKFIAQIRGIKKRKTLFVAFSPLLVSGDCKKNLHKLAEGGLVSLLSKPIALGLLYEHFLKDI